MSDRSASTSKTVDRNSTASRERSQKKFQSSDGPKRRKSFDSILTSNNTQDAILSRSPSLLLKSPAATIINGYDGNLTLEQLRNSISVKAKSIEINKSKDIMYDKNEDDDDDDERTF